MTFMGKCVGAALAAACAGVSFRLFGKSPVEAALPKPETIVVLTYREVIRYLVEERPEAAGSAKGALLREETKDGRLFTFLFLNGENSPVGDKKGKPYARRVMAEKTDDELAECFADNDLVIFE